ncbi:MAG: HAD family phosphatase [Bacteroidetes bacterium]|nr:HAD family phosphatase [Bacteroidota bacterium]MBU2584809.1 HAD family phosphatase [Bacteroidota bacterium]
MHSIKAIIFDLGNVLINFDWSIAEKNLDRIKNNLGEESRKYFKHHPELITSLEKGKLSDNEFLDKCKEELEVKCANEYLAKIFSEIFTPNQELIDILPRLKQKVELYLLSNTNSIHRDYGWGDYKFLSYFKRLFLSYEIGYVKPEKEIFQFVESELDFNKNEFIYIDDIVEYIGAAKNIGWNVIHFRNNEKLFADLSSYGINF